jgi:hypothetical protein
MLSSPNAGTIAPGLRITARVSGKPSPVCSPASMQSSAAGADAGIPHRVSGTSSSAKRNTKPRRDRAAGWRDAGGLPPTTHLTVRRARRPVCISSHMQIREYKNARRRYILIVCLLQQPPLKMTSVTPLTRTSALKSSRDRTPTTARNSSGSSEQLKRLLSFVTGCNLGLTYTSVVRRMRCHAYCL